MTVLSSADQASTRWNDYVGTVAADDSVALAGSRSIYELTGTDREQWVIVGLDVSIAAARPQVTVYAAARGPGQARIEELVDDQGALPVVAHAIADPEQIQNLLDEGFGSLSIRLRPRELSYPLRVVKDCARQGNDDA